MTDFRRDPQLNELVREVNQSAETRPRRTPAGAEEPPAAEASAALDRLLQLAAENSATDLILIPGSVPMLRRNGDLISLSDPVLDGDDLSEMFRPLIRGPRLEQLQKNGSVDFSTQTRGTSESRRFRVNIHRQRGQLAAAVRVLPTQIPTFESLGLPPSVAQLVERNAGLVLVCGSTGAGKSSTLAAMVHHINRQSARHIVTIEDPIEYEHKNMKSIVEQIEVGVDTPSFAAALRSSLRQNPDVILVGEMRDPETIGIAMSAAETGHLVLATLHTTDAVQGVHRIVDAFPAQQQAQIRHQLAVSLNAILSQQLIPRADKRGRVPAFELLIANDAVRNHIRTDKVHNLTSELTLGKRLGMISFEESLAGLVRNGAITAEEARTRSRRPDELDSLNRGA